MLLSLRREFTLVCYFWKEIILFVLSLFVELFGITECKFVVISLFPLFFCICSSQASTLMLISALSVYNEDICHGVVWISCQPANKRNNPVPKEFICDFIKSDGEVCGAKFPTSAGMKNHSKLHYTGKRTFNVISCGKCYNFHPKKSEHVCLSASTSN